MKLKKFVMNLQNMGEPICKFCDKQLTKQCKNMVRHLFQNYDTIYVRFFATYACNLFFSVGFFPQVLVHFLLMRPLLRSTQTYARQTRIYLRTEHKPIYCICVANKHRSKESSNPRTESIVAWSRTIMFCAMFQ